MLMSDLIHTSVPCKVHLIIRIENALYKFINVRRHHLFNYFHDSHIMLSHKGDRLNHVCEISHQV